jgi:sugar lactone lactonase YvrE
MTNQTLIKRAIIAFILIIALIGLALTVSAGEPVIWETNSRNELLRGESRGVSITDTGVLMLAPRFTQVFNSDQPYIWSSTADSAGNIYLGTGHDGRVYRVGEDGRGALLYDAAELDVTALVAGRDGAIYAGTSPDGKVYRITADGKAEVYFDPPDKYIWSLAVLSDGQLAVGTGDNGKLYRVGAAGAKPETSLLIDTNETHVISLAVDAKGQLIAGTDPGGLVLRISPDGKAFALFDAPLREIHALAPAPDGSIYALAQSDAPAGGGAVSVRPTGGQGTDSSAGRDGSVTVSITSVDESGGAVQQQAASRSRNDLSNARSAVFRILADGGTDVLWSSSSITAFALVASPQASGVLIGTADKGRVYAVTDDGRDTLLLQSTEGQISSFVARGREVFAASSNQGKLFRFGPETVSEGSFESPVRDAKLVASWGRIWWRGLGGVDLQTRSGNNERPDATWSEWSTPYRDPAGAQISSPRARFIQWRAVLRAPAGGAGETRMEDVSVAYLPRNVAPEILSITALPVGVGLQSIVQIQADPNIESSGLDPSLFGAVAQVPPRRVFQRGARSLQWQAEDRNNDTLEYTLYYRSLNENSFRLLKDKLRDNFYTVDSAALADGRYVFKVVVTDAPDNPGGQALMGERTSEPVDVDNTPPVVRAVREAQVTGDRVRVVFETEDATGMVKRADVSVDGAVWRSAYPDDGIADSPRERYSLDLPLTGAGEHTISLRVFDMSGNAGSTRITVRR